MSTTTRRKFIDYEQNSRWAKTAFQACSLHDSLMDTIKIFYGLDVELGCRTALEVDIRKGVRRMEADFKSIPGQLDVIQGIERFIKYQSLDAENLIDKAVLQKMEYLYIGFATNPALEVAQTNSYSEPQLMIRTLVALPRLAVLTGVGFICFPLPSSDETPHNLDRHFNEEFTFINPKGIRHIQLGPATLLNHHCEAAVRNVEQFGKSGSGKGIMDSATFYQPTLTRAIDAGEELLIDYGENFFDGDDSVCLCSKDDHQKPRRIRVINRYKSDTTLQSSMSRSERRHHQANEPTSSSSKLAVGPSIPVPTPAGSSKAADLKQKPKRKHRRVNPIKTSTAVIPAPKHRPSRKDPAAFGSSLSDVRLVLRQVKASESKSPNESSSSLTRQPKTTQTAPSASGSKSLPRFTKQDKGKQPERDREQVPGMASSSGTVVSVQNGPTQNPPVTPTECQLAKTSMASDFTTAITQSLREVSVGMKSELGTATTSVSPELSSIPRLATLTDTGEPDQSTPPPRLVRSGSSCSLNEIYETATPIGPVNNFRVCLPPVTTSPPSDCDSEEDWRYLYNEPKIEPNDHLSTVHEGSSAAPDDREHEPMDLCDSGDE